MPERTEVERRPIPKVMIQVIFESDDTHKTVGNYLLKSGTRSKFTSDRGGIFPPGQAVAILEDGSGAFISAQRIQCVTYIMNAEWRKIKIQHIIYLDENNNLLLLNQDREGLGKEKAIEMITDEEGKGANGSCVERSYYRVGKGKFTFRFLFGKNSGDAFEASQRIGLN